MYDLIIVAVHSACINGVGGYWECKKFKLAEVDGKHLAGVTGAELKPLAPRRAKTAVSIRGESFYVNGEITSARKTYRGASVEGLLFNSRMVNAVFDDLNTESRPIWAYPDTGLWDPERNTREFVAAMSDYAAHGLQAVTVSLQGGSPCGNNPADDHPPCGDMYNRDSSSFAFDGRLRANAFRRMGSIIEKADALGMVVFMQLFYPDIAWRIFDSNNGAVLAAADNTVDWLVAHNYTNVVLDVCNECDLCRIAGADTIDSVCPAPRRALHALNWPPLGDHGTLLERIRARAKASGVTLLTSTSYVGGNLPEHDNVGNLIDGRRTNEIVTFDYINIHGNNLWQYRDGSLAAMVDKVRATPTFRMMGGMPIVISEDDGLCLHDGSMSWARAAERMHDRSQNVGGQGVSCWFHWDDCQPSRTSKCALGQAVASRVSWGLFLGCCGFSTCPNFAHKYKLGHGFQCPPINWSHNITSDKRDFFRTIQEATRPAPPAPPEPPPQPPSHPATFSAVATAQRCDPNRWLMQLDRDPEHCAALVRSTPGCNQLFFNHATHGDGNCGCITDPLSDCSGRLVGHDVVVMYMMFAPPHTPPNPLPPPPPLPRPPPPHPRLPNKPPPPSPRPPPPPPSPCPPPPQTKATTTSGTTSESPTASTRTEAVEPSAATRVAAISTIEAAAEPGAQPIVLALFALSGAFALSAAAAAALLLRVRASASYKPVTAGSGAQIQAEQPEG